MHLEEKMGGWINKDSDVCWLVGYFFCNINYHLVGLGTTVIFS